MAAVDTSLPATTYWRGSAVLRLSRAAFGVAERLWPALASRAAARVFTTPLPWRALRRASVRGVGWQAAPWPFERAGLTLYTPREVAPDAPVALLVHGWGGHAGQLLPLADTLAQQGLRPVLLELPAHGASPGRTSNLPQFARAIGYVAARLREDGTRIALLAGHSLGATAAAHAVSRGAVVARLVLIAPAASPRGYTRFFAQAFGLAEPTRAAMQQRIEAREAALMRDFEPGAVAPRVRVPALVVHDRGDRVNAFADGQAFVRALPRAQLLATEALGHRRILQDASVLAQVAVFARP